MSDADLLTRPTVERGDGDDGGDHIIDAEANPVDSLVWTMLCGAQCFAWDNGDIDPPEIDFYYLGSGHEKATCKRCKEVAGLHKGDPK
jgi:hypothetical protein